MCINFIKKFVSIFFLYFIIYFIYFFKYIFQKELGINYKIMRIIELLI